MLYSVLACSYLDINHSLMVGIPPRSPSKRTSIAREGMRRPYSEVAVEFGCAKSTVSRLVKQQREEGSNRNHKPPGRPRKINARTLSRISRHLLKNRFTSPAKLIPSLRELNIDISLSTLQRLMARLEMKRRVARLKPYMNDRVRRLRLSHARRHRQDTLQDWRRTIYCDEAALRMDGTIKQWVTRREGEQFLKECMVPRLQSSKQSIIIWAAVWKGGRSNLIRFDVSESEGRRKGVTAKIYRDQITLGELKRCWNRVNTNWRPYGGARILEDGAPVHTAPINRLAGLRQRFKYLDHPPSSPDLNPIENIWAYLKQLWANTTPRPTSLDGRFEKLQELWRQIPQSVIDKCVDSMEQRMKEVRKRNGWPIKY